MPTDLKNILFHLKWVEAQDLICHKVDIRELAHSSQPLHMPPVKAVYIYALNTALS